MWPAITYETCPWERDPDSMAAIPKSRRRIITATYEAAVPASIAEAQVDLTTEQCCKIEEVATAMARFDALQSVRGYSIPAVLLRSESASSSQIERLTSSAKNVALAELSPKAPANARLIAANVAAMRTALSQDLPLGVEGIVRIHDTLMAGADDAQGLRTEQVWIGGSVYSPHGALFVPPHANRVEACLQDLLAFARRQDIPVLAKVAIFHAQFETIHPFTDGNGRTGRALIHRMLAEESQLQFSMLPVSAGLLHDVDGYMAALDAYHEGKIQPIIDCMLEAMALAVAIGTRVSDRIEAVLTDWRRASDGRGAWERLGAVLVEQPVVDSGYLARRLDVTDRTARDLINQACETGILQKMGDAKRGAFYQAPDIIDILEEISSLQGIRRIVAG